MRNRARARALSSYGIAGQRPSLTVYAGRSSFSIFPRDSGPAAVVLLLQPPRPFGIDARPARRATIIGVIYYSRYNRADPISREQPMELHAREALLGR